MLTPRSSGAPTACHAGRPAQGLRPILRQPPSAPHHWRQLSSNVRHAREDTDIHQLGSPRGFATRSQFMPAVPNQPMRVRATAAVPLVASCLARVSAGQITSVARLHRTSTHCARRLRAPRLNSVATGPGSQRRGALPNPSVKLTRYGSQRLAAPGTSGIMPFAAKPRLPPQAAYLKR